MLPPRRTTTGCGSLVVATPITSSPTPGEIIASQVGNQYLLSSSTQLQMAVARLVDGSSAVALGWVLLHLELFAVNDGVVGHSAVWLGVGRRNRGWKPCR